MGHPHTVTHKYHLALLFSHVATPSSDAPGLPRGAVEFQGLCHALACGPHPRSQARACRVIIHVVLLPPTCCSHHHHHQYWVSMLTLPAADAAVHDGPAQGRRLCRILHATRSGDPPSRVVGCCCSHVLLTLLPGQHAREDRCNDGYVRSGIAATLATLSLEPSSTAHDEPDAKATVKSAEEDKSVKADKKVTNR